MFSLQNSIFEFKIASISSIVRLVSCEIDSLRSLVVEDVGGGGPSLGGSLNVLGLSASSLEATLPSRAWLTRLFKAFVFFGVFPSDSLLCKNSGGSFHPRAVFPFWKFFNQFLVC